MRHLKPTVMGQNPLDRERLWQGLWQSYRSTTLRAIGAVDVALWDIAGKVAGLPVHQLLGSYRSSVPAYASSPVHKTSEAYVEEALGLKIVDGRPGSPADAVGVRYRSRKAVRKA